MAEFSNLNMETVGKDCWGFQNCLEVVVKANDDFIE